LNPFDFQPQEISTAALLEDADRCVACGLCLPHCPTYRKTLSEADSPRGRIQLMKGVLETRIPLNERFIEHIDLCLTCRACENVCPNSVAYGELVDGVRVAIEAARQRTWLERLLRKLALRGLLAKPSRLEKLAPLLRYYQQSGLQQAVRRLGLLRWIGLEEIERQLPLIPRGFNWRESYPATGAARGEVALFLGCVARITDSTTLKAAIFILNRLGYTVRVPKNQTCCGALHQHAGESRAARQLAAQNLEAFALPGLAAVISTASGCGAMLAEYHQTLGKEAEPFAAKVADLSAFLERAEGWSAIAMQPLREKIAVHDPCTLRNVMRKEKAPYSLLQRIPQAQVEVLAGNDQCCGAAGTYFLSQPQMAGLLRDDKIRALQESGASWLATSNVGCAMHLAEGVRAVGLAVKIVHPVTLLARQMGFEA
jgi:glycolate oxidase iron-sulfur subunit